ncbi:MAG: hypothetical protein AMXMBFR84_00910 [Candidatus Hydrogenedentota bacterium]
MRGRELAEALRAGRRVYGTAVTSTAAGWPEMIARTGADFAFIDTEHIPIDREKLSWMCRSFAGLGIPPIVRIPEPNPNLACMALDGGAAGIVAPYIETIEQVKGLRGAIKCRPLKGKRLERYLNGEERLERDLATYIEQKNADHVFLINIESVPALESLDALFAVPDLDAALVGPHDLSVNLGIPEQYTHPVFKNAISTIIAKSRAHNLGVGIHFSWNMDMEIEWAREGANMITHSSDVAIVHETLGNDFKRFREAMGDTKAGGTGGQETVI